MTLALALTGVDSSNPIPGIYPELKFAQGESGGDASPTRVLILAPKASGGTITADTEVAGPVFDESDASALTVAGSPAHRMFRRYRSLEKNAEVYVCCPAEASGSAAVDKITLSGTATGAGVVTVWLGGEQIQAPIVKGDTAAVICGASATVGVRGAINSKTHLPVTADNGSSATITLTGKVAGTELNTLRFRVAVTAGIGISITTPTVDTAFGASGASGAAIGAGTCDYTAALATILAQDFDYIVCHTDTSAQLLALVNQVNTQAEPSTGFRQKIIAGSALSPSNAKTLAAAQNAARLRLVNCEESPEEHYLLAATVGAVFVKNETVDPSYNFDSYGLNEGDVLPLKRPKNDSALPTIPELKIMLQNGVIPIAFSKTGAPYVVRSVTTRHLNASSQYDYRARDSIVVTVGDAFTDDLVAKIAAAPYRKVTEDPTEDGQAQPAAIFNTPKRAKALVEPLVREYCRAGLFDPAKEAKALSEIQTGIDPQVPGRMNYITPAYSAVLLHQSGVLVKETSAAA